MLVCHRVDERATRVQAKVGREVGVAYEVNVESWVNWG